MDILKKELIDQLKNHPGFPTGDQLSSYIFLQDKIGYIQRAPHFFLPTLKVDLTDFTNNGIGTINEFFHF